MELMPDQAHADMINIIEQVCAIDHCDEEPEEHDEEGHLEDDPDAPGLDPELVRKGKERELHNMEKYPIFCAVERDQVDGPLITTKWHCEKKKDAVRCRFVAREFRALDPWRTDCYTPAAEQPTSRVVDLIAVKNGWPIALLDAVCAYFQAKEDENVFTEPPEEWKRAQKEKGYFRYTVWKLLRQLYGRMGR